MHAQSRGALVADPAEVDLAIRMDTLDWEALQRLAASESS